MSPRLLRYLLRSVPVLAAGLLLAALLNLAGPAVGLEWLRVDLWLVGVVWLLNVALRWWSRAEPQRRD